MSADAAPGPALASPATNGAPPPSPGLLPAAGTPYCGLATRMIAVAVDILIIQAVVWMVGAIAAIVAASVFSPPESTQTALIAAGSVVAVLWSAGYFVFFWATTGQTPGNRMMEIRVQDAVSGRPLSLGRCLVRVPAAFLSAVLLFLGYLLILVDSRRRGLHDRLVRSVVVYAPSVVRRRAPRLTR